MLLCRMNGYSHEHNMKKMRKVCWHIDDSKAEITFPPYESMSYYDIVFVWDLISFLTEREPKWTINMTSQGNILRTKMIRN